MRTSTFARNHGTQWTARMQLDDQDFVDVLALLSHTQQQTQEMTTRVAAASATVGLNIYKEKSKILRYSMHQSNHNCRSRFERFRRVTNTATIRTTTNNNNNSHSNINNNDNNITATTTNVMKYN
ncbi:unnamed protein product [Schistosoma margrebowiei]|uniref:Uncharacterized protein n=1 Tax=Schistosoma margrebowiei TaxID=48269 RepID=A0A183M298_9TREM|nr:unnamed protein product [Schistosoma margrebowiei]